MKEQLKQTKWVQSSENPDEVSLRILRLSQQRYYLFAKRWKDAIAQETPQMVPGLLFPYKSELQAEFCKKAEQQRLKVYYVTWLYQEATRFGNCALFKYLLDHEFPIPKLQGSATLASHAASSGDPACFQLARLQTSFETAQQQLYKLEEALKSGCLQMVRDIISTQPELVRAIKLSDACASGNEELVAELLKLHSVEIDEQAMNYAVLSGNKNLVSLLQKKGASINRTQFEALEKRLTERYNINSGDYHEARTQAFLQ